MAKPDLMVRIGNFLFRTRNGLFPLFILAVFLITPPPLTLFGTETSPTLKHGLAIGLLALGLIIRGVVIGFAYIKRGGLKKKVYAENLVTDGMFGVVRNPLYVGNVLVYLGVFVMHGAIIVVAIGVIATLFAYECIIRAEEAYLRDKFGDGYDAYCADVPRWMPKLSRFRESTEGMRFNLLKVILNDYTTVANAVMMLALAQLYEDRCQPSPAARSQHLGLLAWVIGISILCVALIAGYKKRADIAKLFGVKPA
ncbi:hypothetical protein BH11PSE2_BH11PSE2_11880 [soil metagenome]